MRKKILFYISFIIIIVLSALIWPTINLPYEDSTVIGEYSSNKYNQYNDLIRYLVFIFIPILLMFLYLTKTSKSYIWNFYEKFFNINNDNTQLSKNLIYAFFIFKIFLILEFLSISFPIHNIDSFHEGQVLSSAFKYRLDEKLWSGAYVTVGIIYETIASNLAWDFFEKVSIGSVRFFKLFLILILKVLLVTLTFQIARSTNLIGFSQILYFVLISFISIGFINYLFHGGMIIYREIPVLLSIIIFFQYALGKSNSKYFLLLFGPLSCLSIFYSLDRGLVTNIFILFFLICLLVNKDFKIFALSLLSIVFCWVLSYFYLGNEFKFFILNTTQILNEIKLIGGIIHPIPFSGEQNSTRSFKSLFLISLAIIISLDLMTQKKTIFNKKFILFLFIISLLCFLTYGYAIGRADGPHIRSTFGYIIFFYSSVSLYILFKYFEKILFINKINKFSLLITLFLITLLLGSNINPKNIFSFKQRLHTYINSKDELFLKNNEKSFVKNAKVLLENYECIQLFTNDVSMLYLLRKPSCTKFYFPITIGSNKNQLELINKMENIQIILTEIDQDEFSPNFKSPLVRNYISKNYDVIFKEDKWLIMKLKN